MWYTLTYIYIFLKFLVYDMPTIEKIPHLSLDSLGKEAFLPRPGGGAVEKNRQLVSPVTPEFVHVFTKP